MTPLTADEITDLLGETAPSPCAQIRELAARLGPVAMTALVEAVLSIEAQGGLLREDGSRRTPGGVLFFLTRTRVLRAGLAPRRPAPPPVSTVPLAAFLPQVSPDLRKGVATVKVVLSGRPKESAEYGDVVALVLVSDPPQSFPRVLPLPPAEGLTWTVLVSRKQWQAVASALHRDRTDTLVIEGQPCQHGSALVVYATLVMTRAQQKARSAQQKAKAAAVASA